MLTQHIHSIPDAWCSGGAADQVKANNNTNFNGIVLFRSAQNLRYLMKAKMALKGQVYDGLVQDGHSGYDVHHVMEEIDAE